MGVRMERTMDYPSLIDLFVRAGLEIHPEDPVPDGLITCFRLVDEDSGKLCGAAGIVYDLDEYILRCVAVDDTYRGKGYGRMLVDAVMEEALEHHAERLWLTAKVPEFYKKFGFRIIPREEAPFETKCKTCSQYHHGCDSEVMVYDGFSYEAETGRT